MISEPCFYSWENYIIGYPDVFMFSDEIVDVIEAYRVCRFYFKYIRPVYSFEQDVDAFYNASVFGTFVRCIYA